MQYLSGPKITVQEICNETFAYSYSGLSSIELGSTESKFLSN